MIVLVASEAMDEFGNDFRPEYVPTPKTKSPWTTKNLDDCVDLVLKARHHHVFDNVMNRVNRIEEGWQTQFAAVGLTDGDYAGCTYDPEESTGAMTDASKRLRSDPDSNPGLYEKGYVVAQPPTPMPFQGQCVPESAILPAGVFSLREWGEYKVAFGKFKKLKRYYDLHSESSEEMRSYRRYLFSHFDSGSPQLRDAVNYLKAMGHSRDEDPFAGPIIPGTSISRSK